MVDGLFDYNPLAIIKFNIDDDKEEHGEYIGEFPTWVPDELTEYLELKFGKLSLVQESHSAIRNTYKRGKKQGKLLVTFRHSWQEIDVRAEVNPSD